MHDGVQTHDDIPAIPEGVALPDSSGSLDPQRRAPRARRLQRRPGRHGRD